MGRKFFLVSAILILAFQPSFAQRGGRRSGHPNFNGHNPRLENPRDNLLRLSPEERQSFRRNAERWLRMNAQERQALRELEKAHSAQLKSEADAALRQSGLNLDDKKREEFEQRYVQERRKLEHALRREFESKRQEVLPQLNERLKKEFQNHPGSGSPTGSATPAK